jgi:hypothetical protein
MYFSFIMTTLGDYITQITCYGHVSKAYLLIMLHLRYLKYKSNQYFECHNNIPKKRVYLIK